MAHVEKYTASAAGHMFAHYDRTHSSSTSDIDESRTALNYDLAEKDQPLSQLDFLHKRMSEVKVLKRADVIVMCDWVITAPEKLKQEELPKFFDECYKFLCDRYGKENTISSNVHMDETSPHIHHTFVPVVTDKKKGHLKLCAKECLTRKDLITFHTDLSNHMTAVFGRDIGILNGATVAGNKTIKQLRKMSANLEAFRAVPVEEESYVVYKLLGKDKVVIKRSELERVNKAIEDAQLISSNQDSIIADLTEQKRKADRKYEKAEALIAKLDNREKEISEREKCAARFQKRNKEISINNETTRRQLEYRLKECDEREQELLQLENTPHKFYRQKISKLNEEKTALKGDIYQLEKDKRTIEANAAALRKELDENNHTFDERLERREQLITAKYESRLQEKDCIIEALNNTVNGLKAAIEKAYQVICNICRAAAVLWSGKGNMAEYAADLTPKQDNLMYAIIEYGLKATKEADFPDLAEKIENENYIAEDIRQEMPETLSAPSRNRGSYYAR